MSKKETRTQYSLDQKKELIAKVDALVAGGMMLKDAAKKCGINDAYIHTWKRTFKKQGVALPTKTAEAPAANGKIPSIEQKKKWVAQVDELRKAGQPVKTAIVQVGIRPDDYYRYKSQIAKVDGTLPALSGKTDLQMLQFDMGAPKAAPMVLMIGNAEDMKSTLAMLGQVLRGN